MSFNYHGLSSTDYHAKVYMQENNEKAFSVFCFIILQTWDSVALLMRVLRVTLFVLV